MLDATKAFDRVEYCKMFKLLTEIGLPPVIIRLLLNMNTGYLAKIYWNGVYSNSFPVKMVQKQGCVISPVLFCCYIDKLLFNLDANGIGCFIDKMFVGGLAHVDDIVLIAPTSRVMRRILSTCYSFDDNFSIVFNAKKLICLIFYW